MSDKLEPCPELKASRLSRLVFWWSNGLLERGNRGPLTEEKIWDMNPREKCCNVNPVFEDVWQQTAQNMQNRATSVFTNPPTKTTKHGSLSHMSEQSSQDESFERHEPPHHDESERSPNTLTAGLRQRHKHSVLPKHSLTDTQLNGHPKTSPQDIETHGDSSESDRAKPGISEESTFNECRASLWLVIVKTFGTQFAQAHAFRLLHFIILWSYSPYLLSKLIENTEDHEGSVWHGIGLSVLLMVAMLSRSVALEHAFHYNNNLVCHLRSALTGMVFKKALKLSSNARKKYSLGKLTNLLSNDVNRLIKHLTHLTEVLFTPFHIIVVFVQLFRLLGVAAAVGLMVVMVLLPLNIYISVRMRDLFDRLSDNRDEKMKLLNEVLNGIKVLKLHAWEKCFGEKLSAARQKELDVLRSVFSVRALVVFTWSAAMFVISVVMFGVFIFVSGHSLDAKTAFAVVTLLNILRYGVNETPEVVFDVIKASISIKRLQTFLLQDEFQRNPYISDINSELSVFIKDGIFTWNTHEKPSLHNINLDVLRGSLVAVVGEVGCGKSSLLSAMLGEMKRTGGCTQIEGQVSYVTQQAWIQSDTLQNNILFGKPMDRSRYKTVIDACALGPDLEAMSDGDMTNIGERGVNLSGGQKQRVSLARAMYSDADVFLLDDPLAAVDSHVGKHIFDHVISNTGVLKNKTRIWVTHNTRFLPDVDSIVVVANATITETGTYRTLLHSDGDFKNILKTYISEETDAESDSSFQNRDVITRRLPCQLSENEERKVAPQVGLTDAEDRSALSEMADWSLYKTYLDAIGLSHVVWIVLAFASYYILWTYANIWLAQWTDDPILKHGANSTSELIWKTNLYYFSMYAAFGLLMTLSIFLYVFWLAACAVKASKKIHNDLLMNILRSPMSFFDSTPTGRITSLFSRDIDIIDTKLPFCMECCSECILQLGASLIAVCYSTPYVIVILIPLVYIYMVVQRYYMKTSCQLRRLEIKTQSPIISFFTEAVTGYDVIRAFRHEKRFHDKNEQNVDRFHRIEFYSLMANRWLGFRLMAIGNGVTGATSLLTSLGLGSVSGAMLGLAVSFAYEINGTMIWFLILMSHLNTIILSMERVSEYTNSMNEAAWKKDGHDAPSGWPERGRIQFKNYSMRYRDGLDLVLNNISFTIEAGQKVGVVGRTGAGKSSLMLSLFRLVEPEEGAIIIDDVDIADLGLYDLRNNLAIIPQDPVLFTGSLRMNLDPTGQYTDGEIWTALEHTHLLRFVKSLSHQLDAECGEGGQNFSVGQRQLLCLARTLLRKTKVLVLDEATASVDMGTDDLIQQTIRSEFKGCTVLTIAHRLNTVMDYDRILVIEKGEVADLDSPRNLLQKKGRFHKLAKDAGILNSSSI